MQQDLTFISLGQNVESAAQHKAVRSHVSKLNRRNELARKRASKSRSHSGAARPIAPASAKPEYQQLARLGDTTSPRISPLFEGSSTVPQVNAPVTLEVVDYGMAFTHRSDSGPLLPPYANALDQSSNSSSPTFSSRKKLQTSLLLSVNIL